MILDFKFFFLKFIFKRTYVEYVHVRRSKNVEFQSCSLRPSPKMAFLRNGTDSGDFDQMLMDRNCSAAWSSLAMLQQQRKKSQTWQEPIFMRTRQSFCNQVW